MKMGRAFLRLLPVLALLAAAASVGVADASSANRPVTAASPSAPPGGIQPGILRCRSPFIDPGVYGCRIPASQTPQNGLKQMVITGYASPWSVQPGQRVDFMVSSELPRYTAQIDRIYNLDPNPRGPGIQAFPVAPAATYPGHHEELFTGSYVTVPDRRMLRRTGSFSITAWIAPTTVPGGVQNQMAQRWTPTFTHRPQGIVAKWSGSSGYGLFVDPNGGLGLRLGNGRRVVDVGTGVAMHPWTPAFPGSEGFMRPPPPPDVAQGIIPQGADVTKWYFAAASYDARTGRVILVQDPQNNIPDSTRVTVRRASGLHGISPTSAPLLIAAGWARGGKATPAALYNGKIDNPRLYGRALSLRQLTAIERGRGPAGAVANWNFSRAIRSDRVVDTSPNALNGRTVNLPERGVTGHTFDGTVEDFTVAPKQYGAIYFHDDDLADARWPVSFSYRVPASLPSGVYAAKLVAGKHTFWVPFYVTPRAGHPTSSVAFLVPTNSYLAYGQTGNNVFAAPRSLTQYSRHDDGSGVAYNSRLRPITSQQPGMFVWQFVADTHLLGWLRLEGIKVDVITDFDLQRQGASLLHHYRVVLTGTHPEYITQQEQNAFATYVHTGGRLMYMGGNGFYWVTGIDRTGTYTEVRRRDGTEYWQAAPGESVLTLTGQEGGLWRFRGRPPQQLVGVGFTSQGFTVDRPYHRMPGSFDPQAAFVFKGIGPHELIGNFNGLDQPGGAAGEEIDRVDYTIGSPADTIILARASGFPDAYQYVVEEVNAQDSLEGGKVNPLVYADMALVKYLGGGAVFSTSSIDWCASLLNNAGNNTVSRVTQNVLRAFDRAGPLPAS